MRAWRGGEGIARWIEMGERARDPPDAHCRLFPPLPTACHTAADADAAAVSAASNSEFNGSAALVRLIALVFSLSLASFDILINLNPSLSLSLARSLPVRSE